MFNNMPDWTHEDGLRFTRGREVLMLSLTSFLPGRQYSVRNVCEVRHLNTSQPSLNIFASFQHQVHRIVDGVRHLNTSQHLSNPLNTILHQVQGFVCRVNPFNIFYPHKHLLSFPVHEIKPDEHKVNFPAWQVSSDVQEVDPHVRKTNNRLVRPVVRMRILGNLMRMLVRLVYRTVHFMKVFFNRTRFLVFQVRILSCLVKDLSRLAGRSFGLEKAGLRHPHILRDFSVPPSLPHTNSTRVLVYITPHNPIAYPRLLAGPVAKHPSRTHALGSDSAPNHIGHDFPLTLQ